MTSHELSVTVAERESNITTTLPIHRLLNCGYTGRDERAVKAHIDELAEEGIPAPDDFPTFYPKPTHLLSTQDHIEVLGDRTSGEAEFMLLPTDDGILVSVGSDHTNRELETEDVGLSKAVCPNVISDQFWRFSDIADHWDALELRSWVTDGEERMQYQAASVDQIKHPENLLELVESRLAAPLEHTAIFSGSVATETDELVCGTRFETELYDPQLDRRLQCSYDVTVIDWLSKRQ